jgi:NADPH-dependent 2,4-dienoyl-CoA reductase/sulfur reductase-like enzyme
MTRAHIADPHIVNKIAAGKEHEIRPCVGATYCLDRIYEGHEALCIHNPATGREATMPHVIRPAATARRAVVVGAGPAGLEAARVLAARGHKVTVFEAAPEAGGQLRLAARVPRRRELIGIVDWRLARCAEAGVEFHYNAFVGADEVLAEKPEVVIVATGGLPNTEILAGAELAVSTWDILSGDVAIGENVLLYDDNAAHPGLAAAEVIAVKGAALEIVTPERFFAVDVGGLNHVAYARCFEEHGVRLTINKRAIAAERAGNRLKVTLGSDYSERTETREVDQLVVEHGTLPLDDVYFDLKPHSSNQGAVDYEALIAGRPQDESRNPEGTFQLFRIGDAVASRNVHAAIYDALRLCKDV